jgi:putative transposase
MFLSKKRKIWYVHYKDPLTDKWNCKTTKARHKLDALIFLTNFEEKWGSKYAYAVKSWKENWDNLTSYFDFPMEIRKIIYTTNVIESLNNSIRKYTKSKIVFPDDQSALKSVYFSIMNVQKKWNQTVRNWGLILSQFLIIFEERCRLNF